WLSGTGAATYGDSPVFRQVVQLHDQAHTLATRLLALPPSAQAMETDRLQLALQATSTALLAHLEQLIQAPTLTVKSGLLAKQGEVAEAGATAP
ncbi:MAG: hypothetical protein WAV85_14070, partial [Rhodoferax sp.]